MLRPDGRCHSKVGGSTDLNKSFKRDPLLHVTIQWTSDG